CSLKKEPAFYTAWEFADDGKSVTYTLRDDITWADGTKVTGEDIIFAYELAADPATASARLGYTDRFDGPPKLISPNKLQFKFTVAYDRDTQFAQTSALIVPKHLLVDADRPSLKTHRLARQPIAFGPWKLAEHKANQHFVLEPNDKFTGPDDWKPKLKRVMFTIVPEYQTRLLQLKKGDIDLMDGIKVRDADELRKTNPNLNFVRRGYRFNDYVTWNLKKPMFQDKKVRKAMAYALDIDRMINKLLTSESGEVFATQAVGTITPELCATRADIKPMKQDIEKAKALLAEAGWVDTDSDGVVDKDGVKFSFTMLTNKGNERRSEASQLIQADLAKIGIDMQLDTLEFNAMIDRLHKRNYDAALAGWSAGLFVDPSSMWHSGEKYAFNYPSYNNPKVDELIERGLAEPDPAKAAPIWQEMQEIIYDDQPYMFLWWRDEVVAIDNRFEKTEIDIMSLMHNLHKWEVPPEKVKYKF
ncbi:MAG: peptide/nickel transport system substrate-binding protein, partial [Kiritimatiellia bacterium]